jgi:putative methionine-R-sulfoxide reductase with GAF domain
MAKIAQEVLMELFDIARSLSSTLDVDTLLKRIGNAAEQLTNSEASSIMLLAPDKQYLLFRVATGEKGMAVKKMKVKVGEGIAGWVAKNQKTLVVNDVSKDERFATTFDKSSGFQTKSILCVPLMLGEEIIGVAEVLNKKDGNPFTSEDEKILESLGSLASVSISNARFAEDQKNFFIYMIEVIVQAIESRNPKLTGHTWRVAQTATAIARTMDMSGKEYKSIYYASLLHDIGYLATTKGVSLAEGIYAIKKHDPEKTHTLLGWEIIYKINILSGSAPVVRSHHENYDGSGFPDGLKGDKIPLGARILALAEYMDELKIDGFDDDKIREMVESNINKKFDPEVVNIYLTEVAPLQTETV